MMRVPIVKVVLSTVMNMRASRHTPEQQLTPPLTEYILEAPSYIVIGH